MDNNDIETILQLLHLVFLDLYEKNDAQLKMIFRRYTMRPHNSGSYSSTSSYTHLVTLNSAPTRSEAEEMLEDLNRTGDYKKVIKKNPALARNLFDYLLQKLQGHEEEYLARFSATGEKSDVFTPAYRIKVVDVGEPQGKRSESNRYTVYLCHPSLLAPIPIKISKREGELLYLMFLLHPNTVFTKADLYDSLPLLRKIAELSYADYNLHSELKTNLSHEKYFKDLLYRSFSLLNKEIELAITAANVQTGIKEPPDNYILNNRRVEGSNTREYFVRLSAENITMPPSLQALK